MTRWRLSTVEFSALWRALDLGDTPLLLDVPDHSRTLDERDRQDSQAWEELRTRRLVNARGPRPELADALGALARPAVEVDLRMLTGPAQQLRALACSAGLVGIVAVPGSGIVDLLPIRRTELPEALLDYVPEHPRAAGDAVSIPFDLLQTEGLRVDTELAPLERAGLRAEEARQVRQLIAGAVVRRFKIGAAVRDRLGRRHRAPDVVSVLDTELGRVQIRRQWHEGSVRLLLAPTDKQRLRDEIAGLIQAAANVLVSEQRHR
ncbi:MAG: ESX secretion-associated protein EspG [Pseudonocardiaceae bacterium]